VVYGARLGEVRPGTVGRERGRRCGCGTCRSDDDRRD
jgi:hypothetical protein